ncbi:Janus/Ocnus family [Thermodesulfovibrio aggregans]|uniref:Janus/Ocnus family n=2 Tax=Thermodesulfovibrio aggregans TaxID=86166 RepID=A0A0U9HMF9_9BACT|nr:Janus/Ocnus family [Thermodesulfovibrio aggregans]
MKIYIINIMKTIIVNYAELYYLKISFQSLPDKYSGKFVQLSHNDNEYLVFAPKEFAKYHSNILEHFSKEMNLVGNYDTQNKRYDILEPEWYILGGGKFEIDRIKKELKLYDDSMAYGRFNDKGLKERLQNTEEFYGYTILIE